MINDYSSQFYKSKCENLNDFPTKYKLLKIETRRDRNRNKMICIVEILCYQKVTLQKQLSLYYKWILSNIQSTDTFSAL